MSIPGPCVCDWLFRLCPEDQMCLSVPNTLDSFGKEAVVFTKELCLQSVHVTFVTTF